MQSNLGKHEKVNVKSKIEHLRNFRKGQFQDSCLISVGATDKYSSQVFMSKNTRIKFQLGSFFK